MPSDHRRADRVAEAIREEIATFLAAAVKDPRISRLTTVTGVEVTRDLRHAKVFVSVMGDDAERAATFEGLASVAGYLRSRVGRALHLRLAPGIEFRPDESIARAARIESLLAKIKDAQPSDRTGDAPPDSRDAPSRPSSSDGDAED
jgi:ribosome-binding factor A